MTGDRPPHWTDLRGEAKGSTYDARWDRLAAEGRSVHGEADLVWGLLAHRRAVDPDTPPTILDAGCGTGRVAIELARRGATTIGVDRDGDLLASARAKAPDRRWIEADLVDLGRSVEARSVDLAVLAGNVMIFTEPGTERAVLGAVASTVRPGGLVVAGFSIRPGGYDPERIDADAAAVGLRLLDRWSTWGRARWSAGDDYQVSVHVVDADPMG
ncbi:MAG TPA: class I SAM-dependent methyltransferase [Iamia sp.]|nr:class I SAM-dependent methyltransferase [Iamia sp.]